MRTVLGLVTVVAVGLGGCADLGHRPMRQGNPYFVPTAAIVQMPGYETRAQPDQVLPGSDGDYFIARGERTAFGNTLIGGYSAYSVYTYDSQAIAVPGSGFGYRYRRIVQQGFSGLPW